jgi:hypothetical protein
VTLDKTPTQEEWDEYHPALQAKMKAWHEERARQEAVKLHAGDPRYDPMTGDILKPGELPLDATAEYLLTGKTRPRRFIPPGSPFLNNGYKPVRLYEGEQPESEYTERYVERLLKAGFVEVEPVGRDWEYFAFRERLRNMSPYDIARDWQEYQKEARDRLGISEKSFGELLAELAFGAFDLIMHLLLDIPLEDEEKEEDQRGRQQRMSYLPGSGENDRAGH